MIATLQRDCSFWSVSNEWKRYYILRQQKTISHVNFSRFQQLSTNYPLLTD